MAHVGTHLTAITATVRIVLPVNVAPVIELLSAMAETLEHDVKRYMKAHKVDARASAVVDKTLSARAIRKAIADIRRESGANWAEDRPIDTSPLAEDT